MFRDHILETHEPHERVTENDRIWKACLVYSGHILEPPQSARRVWRRVARCGERHIEGPRVGVSKCMLSDEINLNALRVFFLVKHVWPGCSGQHHRGRVSQTSLIRTAAGARSSSGHWLRRLTETNHSTGRGTARGRAMAAAAAGASASSAAVTAAACSVCGGVTVTLHCSKCRLLLCSSCSERHAPRAMRWRLCVSLRRARRPRASLPTRRSASRVADP